MAAIWKTAAGEQAVKESYARFLARWPVTNEQLRLPTSQGETFVVASGPQGAPALVLLHGSAANSASWVGDVAAWAPDFRVYAVDVIGEPGFSTANRPTLASGAYLTWLDEVMAGLGVEHAALAGISLGGWLALHWATNRPERTTAVALLAPGGVGKHRNVALWALPLLLLGPWGRRKVMDRIGGGAVSEGSPQAQAFGAFMGEIFASFRPRTETLPRFTDDALARLTMPVLAILGGRDVFIDSLGTKARLTANCPKAEVIFLPEAGHFLPGQTAAIHAFLRRAS